VPQKIDRFVVGIESFRRRPQLFALYPAEQGNKGLALQYLLQRRRVEGDILPDPAQVRRSLCALNHSRLLFFFS
jgi:hypothetical protein